ncbi:MAG: hypothetical protein JNL43_14525 [Flavobacteriales bacterium]|nr:hypothetical protein [Flavobacteriales bacterium]
MRHTLSLFLALATGFANAQGQDTDAAKALGFMRSMSIPLNAVQFFDRASEAWTWTFGKEPGAKLQLSDREAGIIEGTVRLNFRSTMLTGREESMGSVIYHVRLQIRAGECRAVVSGLSHTGNRTTTRGGIHLGTIMRNDTDVASAGGMSRSNLIRLHAEVRETATTRINSLLQAMEARIRASVEP